MISNINSLSSVASHVNGSPLQGLFARVVDTENTDVVSPPSNVTGDIATINNNHIPTIVTKSVLINDLVHNDPSEEQYNKYYDTK